MKQIVRLRRNLFVTIDSYPESNKTRWDDIAVGALAIILAALSVPALLGIDITKPNPQHTSCHHEHSRSVNL